jgi:hypothetical protein
MRLTNTNFARALPQTRPGMVRGHALSVSPQFFDRMI